MLAMLHHYEELEALRDWFKVWYGRGWEGHLVRGGMCSRGEIGHVLARTHSFTRVLLPRLRTLRAALQSHCGRTNLAKPSLATSSKSASGA